MSPIKNQLTEQEAAAHFVLCIIEEALDAWPTIHESLADSFKERFILEDEKTAAIDLALAAIAQDLQAVKNLFPKEQAERIEKWVLKCLDTETYGEYAVDEVKQYGEQFQKEVHDISKGGDPVSAIPARLLQRWLGKHIHNCVVEMNGNHTGIISPVLLMMLSNMLVAFLGSWKHLRDDFDLIEGDIPLDDTPIGFKDYTPAPVDRKPDGTIQYYDEAGHLKEKWLPPEQIEELLKKGGAIRSYRALVKGPWDGVKETLWELSDDEVEHFLDEDGCAYAVCAYEKGQPQYVLTKKKMWDRMDEVHAILLNPNLSEEQRLEELKHLAKD